MRQRRRQLAAEQQRAFADFARRTGSLEREVVRLKEVLDTVPLGVVVIDETGVEMFRNRRGTAPTGDTQLDVLILRALAGLLEGTEHGPRQQVVDLHGPPPRTVALSAGSLSSGGSVGLVEDTSERTQLDNVRRDFVANVNHELRTPIGALGVLAEALQGETEPQVIERLVGRMLTEVSRAQSLIEDLLDLGRIEHGASRTPEIVDIKDLLAAAVRRVQPMAEQGRVSVEVGPAKAGSVMGQPADLLSAVVNLLDNAVKYSDVGSLVRVEAHRRDSGVDIVVRDRGAGIPSKDRDRIFERFYRVDRARDRRTGGSGLGLAIVRHVAVNHGGEVTVESVEGEGSTFTIHLPGPL